MIPSQSAGFRAPFERPNVLGRAAIAMAAVRRGKCETPGAAGRLKVGAWLRRALRGGVHDESCPYLRSPCGERGQHVVLSLPLVVAQQKAPADAGALVGRQRSP